MPAPTFEIPSMVGKTCIVTGATSGIGEVTAACLASAGASVVLIGRDPARCESTVAAIRAKTGSTKVRSLVADLSSQAEIRRLAEQIRVECPRIDVLVNNAGAMFPERLDSVDGIEMTWALNHLAYFLLTNLLLDKLKASAPARIVNVASDAHRSVRGLNWDDLEGRQGYRTFGAYAQSKLANILFSDELARRLEGSGVTSNSLHPGFVNTRFFVEKGRIGWVFKQAARFLAIPPVEGAVTSVYLAISPDLKTVSGQYFEKCQPGKRSKASQDPEAAKRLWELSEKMTRSA